MGKSVNEKIKQLRKEHRMTQEEMGEILGIKRSTYAHMEAYGNFKAEQVKKIADYFKVSAEYILGETTVRPSPHSPLTVDEQILLELFNKLSPDQQREVLLELAKK